MKARNNKAMILLGFLIFVAASSFAASVRLDQNKVDYSSKPAAREAFSQNTSSAQAVTHSITAGTNESGVTGTAAASSSPTSAGNVTHDVTGSPKQKISFTFVGDILLEDYLSDMIKNNSAGIVMGDVKRFFDDSDITAGNLENPISQKGEKAEDKQFTFRAKPEYASVLTSAGIDAVSLANNHILDFGQEAMFDTFRYLEQSGVLHAGAGYDLEGASKPVYISRNGLKVAFIATSHVIPFVSWAAAVNRPGVATTYDPAKVREEIRNAKRQSDLVIVYVHWGEEKNTEPVQYQKNLARLYIDDGADIVIGSHPHVLQGLEYYKGRIIAYSLGNFVFTDALKDSMVLAVAAEKGKIASVKVIPCQIRNYRPEPIVQQDELKKFYENIEKLSFDVIISNNGLVTKKQ